MFYYVVHDAPPTSDAAPLEAHARPGRTNIRARGLNSGSYRDRVRGYAREFRDRAFANEF